MTTSTMSTSNLSSNNEAAATAYTNNHWLKETSETNSALEDGAGVCSLNGQITETGPVKQPCNQFLSTADQTAPEIVGQPAEGERQ